jgi:2-ketocyclohexanecarboxyl-CoA hydrolase
VSDPVRTEVVDETLVVTLDRPKANAIDVATSLALHDAFARLERDPALRVGIVTGAGERFFSAGWDLKAAAAGEAVDADHGPGGFAGLTELFGMRKPVIAAVNGLAIGGGHVLHVLCDVSIASETARFGQAGPRVGSFDAGFGSAYLARVVGEKKAREMWFWCRQYSAQEALAMNLVNRVVPADRLLAEAKEWVAEVATKSPTAIRFLKQSFNADTDHQAGFNAMAMTALDLFSASPEGKEGAAAFAEKRQPEFDKHVAWH